jgi:hypothetical protein
VFTEDGVPRATVTADRGRMEQGTSQTMLAQGNVILILPAEDRRIESEELWYDGERVWSDSATTYRNNGRVTRGSCFRSNLSFTEVEVCSIRGAADLGGG